MSTNENQSQTIRVPIETGQGEPWSEEVVNVRALLARDGDLGALRARDPFLYHSIPTVHRAALALEEIDPSSEPIPAAVPRKTRLTTECHVGLLLDGIVDNGEVLLPDGTVFDDDELLLPEGGVRRGQEEEPILDLLLLLGVPPSREVDNKERAQ